MEPMLSLSPISASIWRKPAASARLSSSATMPLPTPMPRTSSRTYTLSSTVQS